MKRIISSLLVLCIAATALVGCDLFAPDDETSDPAQSGSELVIKPAQSGIVLNELMASNKKTLADNYGEYSDWVELYNNSAQDISLLNYMLTDDPARPERYIFPDITIKAGEYLLLYASGRTVAPTEDGIIHLPFKINYVSETVCLFSSGGVEIGRITVSNVPSDYSCGPDASGRTVIFAEPTPGAQNVTATYTPTDTPDVALNTKGKDVNTVRINEYATSDSITIADEDGDYGAWVELYNYGSADVAMYGLFLSDNPDNTTKWAFPDLVLKAGEYITVFLEGKEKTYTPGAQLHATFTLTGKEETLAVYNGAGVEMDTASVYELVSNITYGRSADSPQTWLFFPKATPNAENTVTGFESIESARYPSNKAVFINEIVAVNRTLSAAPDGKSYSIGELYDYYDLYDYIEIYNPTDSDVTLSDFFVGKKSFSAAIQLPEMTLPSGGYKVIYFDDETYFGKSSIYLKLGLNRYGSDVYIYDKNGVCIDSVSSGRLFDTTSCGRASTQDDTIYYFSKTTPGEKNAAETLLAAIAPPTFGVQGGYYAAGTTLELKASEGAEIYYTTNGDMPTTSSMRYTAPVQLSQTVTVRAIAYKSGHLPSEDVSQSYVIGRQHDIAVICLSTDADNLFSDKYGILADGLEYDPGAEFPYKYSGANYWENWERPIHFDYIDESGTQVLSFNAGIKVFGQYSRAKDQKSVSIYLRDKYGPKEVCYPFFGSDYINVFSSLALRSSGQDGKFAHIRDAYCAELVRGEMDIDVMAYRPVAVYINGEYFGLYDLRERINEDYVAHHTGADPDNVDLIKGGNYNDTRYNVLEGTIDEYAKLVDYLKSNSLKSDANYQKACEMVDVDELINYWICVIFFTNTDSGNIKYYKENTEGKKWRWILYDADWALFPSTYLEYNMFEEVLNPDGHGVGNNFSTLVLRSFMNNAEFKDRFLTTFGKYLNTIFTPEHMTQLFDEMIAEISSEMVYHIARWEYQEDQNKLSTPYTVASWERNVASLRRVIEDKRRQTIADMVSYFRLSEAEQTKYLGE